MRSREPLFAAVGAVAVAIALTLYITDAFNRLELDTVDARFAVRGDQDPPEDLVVVKVDDKTFDELDLQWPFPRSIHGDLIDRLDRAGARVIAYDVQFTEPTSPRQDNALIRSVDRADGVVLGTTEVDSRGGSNVFGGERVVRSVGARSAYTGLPLDPGGIVRRVPAGSRGLESFGVAAAEVATNEDITQDEFGEGSQWIDFRGPPGTVESVSFSDALSGDAPPGTFDGKIVVVGAAAPSLQDVHPTAVGGGAEMSGPELQANMISTVLDGFPLDDAPGWVDIALIVLLGSAVPVASFYLSPRIALVLGLVLAALFVVSAQLAFELGTIVPLVYPLVGLVAGSIGTQSVYYVLAALDRQRIRDVFARFVPERVVDDVLARTDDDLRLGGVNLQATVMFSDLRGFTSFAETIEPEQVIEVLNRYLGSMSDAITAHDGTLVAYMGDGIMAVFGAPLEQDDHADRALAAAREMLGPRLEEFNAWLRREGLGDGFRMGIGLNSGPVMSGNVGSDRRVEYTAIGDTVNTASRLESMTKEAQQPLLIAGSTRALLHDPAVNLTFVDELSVRGRRQRIEVWSLVDDRVADRPDRRVEAAGPRS